MSANNISMFQSVSIPEVDSSAFDASHPIKYTTHMGAITPLECLNVYPGDQFRLKYTTMVNFPPLVAPAYQGFTLKSYLFKVRKALTWSNDSVGKYIVSLTQPNQACPVQPFIKGDSMYHFGMSGYAIRFCPKMPVYGRFLDGKIQLTDCRDIPQNASVNAVIGVNSSVDQQKLVHGSPVLGNLDYWKSSLKVTNLNTMPNHWDKLPTKDGYNDPQLDSSIYMLNWDVSQGEYTGVSIDPDQITDGNTRYNVMKVRNRPFRDATMSLVFRPFCPHGSLGESLDYPTSNIDNNTTIPDLMYSLRDDYAQQIAHYFSKQVANPAQTWLGTVQMPIYAPDGGSNRYWTTNHVRNLSIWQLFYLYAYWCIDNGYGDGTLPPDDVCPIFYIKKFSELYTIPQVQFPETDTPDTYDAGRIIAFWKIYDEYFRDANITRPMDFAPFTHDGADCVAEIPNVKYWAEQTDYDNVQGMEDIFQDETMLFDYFIEKYFRRKPQKMLDKDYLSALLPSTSRIEVFSPTFNGSEIVQRMNEINKEAVFTLGSNFYDTYKGHEDNHNIPDYTTFPVHETGTGSFISVDAFRTAELLQRFFKQAMYCQGKPVATILSIFGTHSKDFRFEVPQLIDTKESPIRIEEITQQSGNESADLGQEAGKMYCVSNSLSGFMDDDGDLSYIIPIVCVYPNTTLVGGLNQEIIADTAVNSMFIPQFSTLGEEAVPISHAYYGAFPYTTPNLTDSKLAATLGYTPRYSRFKFQLPRVKGRFCTDMNYWTLDRILDVQQVASQGFPQLDVNFISTPVDNRLFASDEIDNCYCFTQCSGTFVRKLPPYVQQVLA